MIGTNGAVSTSLLRAIVGHLEPGSKRRSRKALGLVSQCLPKRSLPEWITRHQAVGAVEVSG
jgi:hypothetical protein